MTVKITKSVKITGAFITLDQLRELVVETEDFPGERHVSITASRDPREGNFYSIGVSNNG